MNVRMVSRRIAVLGFAAMSLIAVGATPASADVGGILTLDPNTGLVDNQQATLYGSSFKPNFTYGTVECRTRSPFTECNNETGSVRTDSTGSFTVAVVLRRYITYYDPAVGHEVAYDCAGAPRSCVALVYDPNTLDDVGTTMSFKASK